MPRASTRKPPKAWSNCSVSGLRWILSADKGEEDSLSLMVVHVHPAELNMVDNLAYLRPDFDISLRFQSPYDNVCF